MSRAVVVGEYRLVRGPDGAHYADSVFGHSFWNRYLEVFDEVVVVARTAAKKNIEGMLRVDGPGVSVFEMPYYVGLTGYLRKFIALRRAAKRAASLPGSVILRLPGAVGERVAAALPSGRTYGVEVVGDPADVFDKGVVDHPLRRVIRAKSVNALRRRCAGAASVAYVSRYQLADRYPPGAGRPAFTYSSASIPDSAFSEHARIYNHPLTKLIAVGSMDQLYKGFDILLPAVAHLREEHPGVNLTIVGDGRHRPALEILVKKLGLAESVTFTGMLRTLTEVLSALDQSELFVSSSRTEGLPRTVIEAQARGLATIGTWVGSTPELLPHDAMCEPGNIQALAALISRFISNPELATANASTGRATATRYSYRVLQKERNEMFQSLLGGAT